jgi:hypothetical protein
MFLLNNLWFVTSPCGSIVEPPDRNQREHYRGAPAALAIEASPYNRAVPNVSPHGHPPAKLRKAIRHEIE